jgi:hypothetical protein
LFFFILRIFTAAPRPSTRISRILCHTPLFVYNASQNFPLFPSAWHYPDASPRQNIRSHTIAFPKP